MDYAWFRACMTRIGDQAEIGFSHEGSVEFEAMCVVISAQMGERWFCTEAEAIAAGDH